MVSLEIIRDWYNPVLERREVEFEVRHEMGPTPSREEVKKALVSKIGADPELTYIIKLVGKTGMWKTVGVAHVYQSKERAKLLVPQHVAIRELPKEERQKAREALAEARKAKKAEAAKGRRR